MRKLIPLLLLLIVSCKNYKDFMGYASNDNSDCFSNKIFSIKDNERVFPEKYVDSVMKEGTLIKENELYVYEYRLSYDGYYIPVLDKKTGIIKNLFYHKNRLLKSIDFNVNNEDVYKETIYNKQGAIIKDTLYNNYNIC